MIGNQNRKSARKKGIKHLDQATADIIRGLNYLIAQAQKEELFTVTSILRDAWESTLWWATDNNYEESDIRKLLHQLTLDRGVDTALDFLAKYAAVKDDRLKAELLESLQQSQFRVPFTVTEKRS